MIVDLSEVDNMGKTHTRNKKNTYENKLANQLREAGVGGFKQNARFITGRKYEADFYWPALRLIVEVDGGIWMKYGGHTSGTGYSDDRVRDVLALRNGIVTVRVTTGQVKSDYAIENIIPILQDRAREVGYEGDDIPSED